MTNQSDPKQTSSSAAATESGLSGSQAGGSIPFVLFASAVTAIGGFLFGYDTAVINGANTYLQSHFALDPERDSMWIGLATASAIYGCVPGAMFAGFFSDKFGRRRVLFFCAILFALSAILSAIPQTFSQFIAARVLSGIAIGISSMICPVYIAEIAPAKWRGRLGALGRKHDAVVAGGDGLPGDRASDDLAHPRGVERGERRLG